MNLTGHDPIEAGATISASRASAHTAQTNSDLELRDGDVGAYVLDKLPGQEPS
jgi:hypothetical protein